MVAWGEREGEKKSGREGRQKSRDEEQKKVF